MYKDPSKLGAPSAAHETKTLPPGGEHSESYSSLSESYTETSDLSSHKRNRPAAALPVVSPAAPSTSVKPVVQLPGPASSAKPPSITAIPRGALPEVNPPREKETPSSPTPITKPVDKGDSTAVPPPNSGGNEEQAPTPSEGAPPPPPAAKNGIPVLSMIRSVATQRVVLSVLIAVSAVHVLFLLLSCVLSQLDGLNGACYTFWGFKSTCSATVYTIPVALLSDSACRSSLQAGAAFAILSLLVWLLILGVLWLMCTRARRGAVKETAPPSYVDVDANGGATDGIPAPKPTEPTEPPFDLGLWKRIGVGLMLASFVLELIQWAIIASLMSGKHCLTLSVKDLTYGAGFGLGLTAWILTAFQILALLFLL